MLQLTYGDTGADMWIIQMSWPGAYLNITFIHEELVCILTLVMHSGKNDSNMWGMMVILLLIL